MTAVAAPYEDLLPIEAPLTESLLEQLDERAVESLLLRRFRLFLGRGHRNAEALLLAVGYTEADAALAAESFTGSFILH